MGKLGMVFAFAIGYVLGARAGRERYDELVGAFRKLRGASAESLPRDERGRFVARDPSA